MFFHKIGEILEKYFFGGIVPLFLAFCGIFFIIYLRFPFSVLCERRDTRKNNCQTITKNKKRAGISGFSALTVALAGTLGVGNITGVASALILGGAGSIFWMWVSALLAMVLKYAEIVLAHGHARVCGTEKHGGAMYYLRDGFRGEKGRGLALVFSFFCLMNSLAMGCMLQSEAVTGAFRGVSRPVAVLVGAMLALLVALVVFGGDGDGGGNIPTLTTVIIPVMSALYVVMSLCVIIKNVGSLPHVLREIFRSAFNFHSAVGGTLGFGASRAIRYGFMRGLLSNEAGCGTAPTAHASSSVVSPRDQGLLGVLEVFVDTILLCSATAFSILLTVGTDAEILSSFAAGGEMRLVLASYSSFFGKNALPLMATAVFFFAYATIVCQIFYGVETLRFLTHKKRVRTFYKLFCLVFVFLGAAKINAGGISFFLSDLALGSMTVINLAALLKMRKEIKKAGKS